MEKKKIVTVIGARPQFIKAAAVSRIIKERSELEEVIIHTGQHFDENMSDIFFEEMNIPKPHYNLNINGLSHGAMTGQMLEKIENVIISERPDILMVYGDTNSTLAGALAARKLHIKVAHVEAGLRSFNMEMPEEVNRIITDRISDLLFCPTEQACENLISEGYRNFNITIKMCGDVMQDAAMYYASRCRKPKEEMPEKFVLCTLHRAENTDAPDRLNSLFSALEEIADKTGVLIPLHPRTKNKLKNLNYDFKNSKINFIEPVGYLEMVWLLQHCRFVMTDSGGLQKEAYFFGKYCITLRDETEWVELVDNGYNILSGADKHKIIDSADKILQRGVLSASKKLYGNGDASVKIVDELLKLKIDG